MGVSNFFFQAVRMYCPPVRPSVRPHALSQICVPDVVSTSVMCRSVRVFATPDHAAVAIVGCSCGRRHVEMRCVDMWRLQLSCMSHPVAIFACLVHTARGSIVALSALHPGHSCRFSFRVAVQHLQSADNWPKVSRRDSNDPPFEMGPRFSPPWRTEPL